MRACLLKLRNRRLTDGEAREIMVTRGAPDSFATQQRASLINALSHRHPGVFVGIIMYLQKAEWDLDDSALTGLFARTWAGEINGETVLRLLDTVQEDAARDLLYRLNLVVGAFDIDAVGRLAAVLPTVSRPREKLSALAGLWVQNEAGGQMIVSPLIKMLGDGQLDVTTRRTWYHHLGRSMLERHELTGIDVLTTIHYCCNAGELNRAGAVLAQALSEMLRQGMKDDPNLLTSFWWPLPLPQEMDLVLRLHLRGQQIALNRSLARELPPLVVRDLVALVDQARQTEAFGVVSSVSFSVVAVAEVDYQSACDLVLRQAQVAPDAVCPDGQRLHDGLAFAPESLVWTLVPSMCSIENLSSWMTMIDGLTREEQARAFSGVGYEVGSISLAARFWQSEANRPEDEQRWESAVTALTALAEFALRVEQDLLWAGAIRGIIMVRALFQDDITSALDLAEGAFAKASDVRVNSS